MGGAGRGSNSRTTRRDHLQLICNRISDSSIFGDGFFVSTSGVVRSVVRDIFCTSNRFRRGTARFFLLWARLKERRFQCSHLNNL
jgi:hypothetical protein